MTNPPSESSPETGPQSSPQSGPQSGPQSQPPTAPYPLAQPRPQGYPPYGQPGPYAWYGYYGQPAQPTPPAKKHVWRAAAVGVVAGAVLAAAVAIPTTIAIEQHRDTASSSAGTQQQNPFSQFGEGTDPFGGSSGSSGTNPFGEGGGTGSGSTTDQSGTKATSAQSKGVVLINTVLNGGAGAGTGMVVDSNGLVLTNYHVVEGSTSIKVTIASTGKTYTASVVGRDKSSDVALIKLSGASGLDTVKIDKDAVSTRDKVTAVGNAAGQGYLSAVSGTIVATDQHITASEGDGYADSEALSGLLETDAAVVPGYSGGPLYDAQGEVTGIDTAASTNTSAMGATTNAGQAYAIPIAAAMKIAEQIENGDESGSVQIGPSAFLGIGVARQAGTTGAQVAEVEPSTPAAKAGLAVGDTITRVDGKPITTYTSLTTELATHQPGDKVSVTWTTTQGRTKTATVTLGSSPVN